MVNWPTATKRQCKEAWSYKHAGRSALDTGRSNIPSIGLFVMRGIQPKRLEDAALRGGAGQASPGSASNELTQNHKNPSSQTSWCTQKQLK
eukprot:2589015-Amphidinium_carterae.2